MSDEWICVLSLSNSRHSTRCGIDTTLCLRLPRFIQCLPTSCTKKIKIKKTTRLCCGSSEYMSLKYSPYSIVMLIHRSLSAEGRTKTF